MTFDHMGKPLSVKEVNASRLIPAKREMNPNHNYRIS